MTRTPALLNALFLALLTSALLSCNGTRAVSNGASAKTATPAATTSASATVPGVALYTLREEMGEDPRATLAQVAELGYVNIEAAGYNAEARTFYGMAPAAFKTYVTGLGLVPKSTHMGMVTRDNVDALVADAKAAGFEYLVIPVPPMGAFGVEGEPRRMVMKKPREEVLADINFIAERGAAGGVSVLYHNHDFEFAADADGLVPIDYFLANSDPEVLNFQMDLFWVTKAGADPVAYVNKYPGRWRSFHVKDMDAEGRFAPVGKGTIDFSRVLAVGEKAGLDYALVEQDQTFDGMTALEAIEVSRGGLEALGMD